MPSPLISHESGNHLLDLLPADEFSRIVPDLQRVGLVLKQVIQEFDAKVIHVYFPTTAMASLLIVMEEDDPIEAATVGHEGLVGVSSTMGVQASPHRVICQIPGECLRLPVQPLLDAIQRGPVFARLVHRYNAYMIRTISQGIACNALHTVEARTCRWLLTTHDQAGSDEFPMTQEFLAYMLGVRRQSVTVVAGVLQAAGMIKFRRGIVVIQDRSRLEEAACECYATIRDYYRRIIS